MLLSEDGSPGCKDWIDLRLKELDQIFAIPVAEDYRLESESDLSLEGRSHSKTCVFCVCWHTKARGRERRYISGNRSLGSSCNSGDRALHRALQAPEFLA